MFQMRKAIRLRQERIQKQMNINDISASQIKKMSPRHRGELEKVIFEEWTVMGKQEVLKALPVTDDH